MLLSDRTTTRWNEPPLVVRVTTDASRPSPLRSQEALLVSDRSVESPSGFKMYFSLDDSSITCSNDEHDFVVQARGAFDETVHGILNLARCGLRVELRVVITKINFEWLPRISRFISRNFPFVSNVAFMGLEPVGLAKGNLQDVWIDPADYGTQLEEAVQELRWHRIPVSVYNHQLCTISPTLWDVSHQSISDWKNIFLSQCEGCAMRHRCCGFFASGTEVHSRAIKPLASCD